MTTTLDGHSEGHGPAFVGIYVQLLARYLRLDSTIASALVVEISWLERA